MISEDAIDIIMNSSIQIEPEYLDPFTEELNMNLLSIDNLVQKRSLIKYYIYEFRYIQDLYNDYKKILLKKNGYLFEISFGEYEFESYEGERIRLSLIENYIVNSYELFRLTFDVIQHCCIKEGIDFIVLCNELNFALDFVELDISDDFNKQKKEYIKLDPVEEKLKYFKAQLNDHGFFNLTAVDMLSDDSKYNLIKTIFTKGLPYAIAMFDYLDFFKILGELYINKNMIHREVSNWFNSDERSIRGYINVLNITSKEDKDKYTTRDYKEIVENDYIFIKSGECPPNSP